LGGYASNYGTTVGVVDETKFLLSVGGSFLLVVRVSTWQLEAKEIK
jgi:hypothetical protein